MARKADPIRASGSAPAKRKKNPFVFVKDVDAFAKDIGVFIKNAGVFVKNIGVSIKNAGVFVKDVGADLLMKDSEFVVSRSVWMGGVNTLFITGLVGSLLMQGLAAGMPLILAAVGIPLCLMLGSFGLYMFSFGGKVALKRIDALSEKHIGHVLFPKSRRILGTWFKKAHGFFRLHKLLAQPKVQKLLNSRAWKKLCDIHDRQKHFLLNGLMFNGTLISTARNWMVVTSTFYILPLVVAGGLFALHTPLLLFAAWGLLTSGIGLLGCPGGLFICSRNLATLGYKKFKEKKAKKAELKKSAEEKPPVPVQLPQQKPEGRLRSAFAGARNIIHLRTPASSPNSKSGPAP